MITYISNIIERAMGERLHGRPGKSCHGLPDGAQTAQQDVRTITITLDVELATKLPQPEHRLGRPTLAYRKDELSGRQDQSEDAAHPFQRAYPQVFDI